MSLLAVRTSLMGRWHLLDPDFANRTVCGLIATPNTGPIDDAAATGSRCGNCERMRDEAEQRDRRNRCGREVRS